MPVRRPCCWRHSAERDRTVVTSFRSVARQQRRHVSDLSCRLRCLLGLNDDTLQAHHARTVGRRTSPDSVSPWKPIVGNPFSARWRIASCCDGEALSMPPSSGFTDRLRPLQSSIQHLNCCVHEVLLLTHLRRLPATDTGQFPLSGCNVDDDARARCKLIIMVTCQIPVMTSQLHGQL